MLALRRILASEDSIVRLNFAGEWFEGIFINFFGD